MSKYKTVEDNFPTCHGVGVLPSGLNCSGCHDCKDLHLKHNEFLRGFKTKKNNEPRNRNQN